MHVVAGSDGQSSLSTVEIFDPVSKTWSFGPSLKMARANVGVSVVGNQLFAIGGFSGKVFLDTIEYIGEDDTEWINYMPHESHNGHSGREDYSPKVITSVMNGHKTEKIPEEFNGHSADNSLLETDKINGACISQSKLDNEMFSISARETTHDKEMKTAQD